MLFKKKKKMSISQVKAENLKLTKRHEEKEELTKAQQENYRLKHRKSLAFFQGVGKIGKSVGKYAVKKATTAPKKFVVHKGSKKIKPLGLGDFI